MVFSSGLFLLYFLPIAILMYQIIPGSFKNLWLLVLSLAFYFWGAPLFIYVVLGTSLANFIFVRQMQKPNSNRKFWLVAYITSNLLLLGVFKYFNFFAQNFSDISEYAGNGTVSFFEIALPIGISFFIFQSITYAVDVYRKEAPALNKFTDYLFYILFFPQLIAGPIVRYKDIAKQIIIRKLSNEQFVSGFHRFSIGLAKKALIANTLGEFYMKLQYGQGILGFESSSTAWLMALTYTMQLFFDFSGYSDMAIGIGRMVGFSFPENFDKPYLSKSITEFWRRWHITLGTFMLHYLYIPLGGNRKKSSRIYVNLLLVFFLSGLWHGAAWNFVIWGLFHGFWIILDRLFLKKVLEKLGIVSILFTFFVVLNGWVLFSANSMAEAWHNFEVMYAFNGVEITYQPYFGYFTFFLTLSLILVIISAIKPYYNLRDFIPREKAGIWNSVTLLGITTLLYAISFCYVLAADYNPFIYFKF